MILSKRSSCTTDRAVCCHGFFRRSPARERRDLVVRSSTLVPPLQHSQSLRPAGPRRATPEKACIKGSLIFAGNFPHSVSSRYSILQEKAERWRVSSSALSPASCKRVWDVWVPLDSARGLSAVERLEPAETAAPLRWGSNAEFRSIRVHRCSSVVTTASFRLSPWPGREFGGARGSRPRHGG